MTKLPTDFSYQQSPIGELLGFNFIEANDGNATLSMEVTEKLFNPVGTLHGGVLGDLSDAAIGCALMTMLPANQFCTSVDLRVNFFRPVYPGVITAKATVLRKGTTLAYMECSVFDQDEKIVAHVTSTCMILAAENGERKRPKK